MAAPPPASDKPGGRIPSSSPPSRSVQPRAENVPSVLPPCRASASPLTAEKRLSHARPSRWGVPPATQTTADRVVAPPRLSNPPAVTAEGYAGALGPTANVALAPGRPGLPHRSIAAGLLSP
ncbi:hypothetical protein [Photorhabdus sp. CRCIA-P01]|uniref:hypothetical protein n=1 Tax=Photorhabdus sp. CRCIA-P01 TaxID=2019570 RepID=UPI001E3E4028|nr:hypothetical protein [Photorhabdus sp. CRCIA-P01]